MRNIFSAFAEIVTCSGFERRNAPDLFAACVPLPPGTMPTDPVPEALRSISARFSQHACRR